jgi:uncharacterized protein
MMQPVISIKDYQAALQQNRLLGAKCAECGFVTAPPRWSCRKCASQQLSLVELSGKGKVASFTSVHVATHSRHGFTPYLVVLVELAEGPWIMGNLHWIDPDSANLDLIGRPVKMDNRSDNEPADGPVPQFYLES